MTAPQIIMPRVLRYLTILLLLPLLWGSCRKDFDYAPSTGGLLFSRDTVYLDTIFSGIGSSTYTLKVYNGSNKDISVPTISLKSGENSSYRLNVDGVAGKSFQNVPILARDSIFIRIENTYEISDPETAEFLSTDVLLFHGGESTQEVPLVTLVRDAIFLYPGMSPGETANVLDVTGDGTLTDIISFDIPVEHLSFTARRPYVIYGYAAVGVGKRLEMEAGTRVFFHKDSGILVGEGASINIYGELSADGKKLEREVIFEADRLEPAFENEPGQWGTIWLSSQSLGSTIDHLTIKNATVGLLVDGNPNGSSPTLFLKNTQIHNSSHINLWSRSGNIQAENTVLGSAGKISLHCQGGAYSFVHSTIANHYGKGFRLGPALQLDNYTISPGGETLSRDLGPITFTNCIIDGSSSNEMVLNAQGEDPFPFYFDHCMIRSSSRSGEVPYNFGDNDHYNMVLLNQPADFLDPQKNNLGIGMASAAIGTASPVAAQEVPLDILGRDRTLVPTIGAYLVLERN